MLSTVINWLETKVIEDGCGGTIYKVIDRDNSKLEKLEIAMCVFTPSEVSQLHHHNRIEEVYFILEGQGQMQINEEWHNIHPGDAIAIPAGVKHQIRNASANSDLRFLSINTPEWAHEDMIIDNA